MQCPASTHERTIESCDWHAEEVTFALLKEFMHHLIGRWLHKVVRQYVAVVASQVFLQLGKDQSSADKPDHYGQCLLHAACGNLMDQEMVAPIMQLRDTSPYSVRILIFSAT